MESPRWVQVKSIFLIASSQEPVKQTQFLEESCREDPALRLEVEALLKAHHQAKDFLETPASNLAARWMEKDLAAETAPERLGPWRILREIGGGGMSRVYLVARADEQFQKCAALKILGLGMFGEDIRQRFTRERQILADLDHPNVVRLLDGGVAPDGRPYLVMDYVDGESLTQYVQRCMPSTEDRLKLFLNICDTVAYAHRQSIVHRDLKPSNIMVTSDGAPKLLDFGIAKLLQTDGRRESTRTETRYFTLDYASPEQARGEPAGAASDVYSLGLILYRLLLDRHPYNLDGLTSYEAVQVICEEPPDLQSVPKGLRPVLGRALEKQPSRRYASVGLLAVDVRRYQDGLPIAPLTPSPRKRKKGVVLVLAGALVVALMILIGRMGLRRGKSSGDWEQITFDTGWTGHPTISPDGTLLAYVSDRGERGTLNIWIQNLVGRSRPIQLTSEIANDSTPDFAPDGKSLAFRSSRDGGGIYVVPVSGGAVRKVANEGFSPRFSPNGVWIAYSAIGEFGNSSIFVVPAAGGEPRKLAWNMSNAQCPL